MHATYHKYDEWHDAKLATSVTEIFFGNILEHRHCNIAEWNFVSVGTQGKDAGGEIGDVFRDNIIAKVAAKRELGLQLLFVDICNTAKNAKLPETLRYLFLSDR